LSTGWSLDPISKVHPDTYPAAQNPIAGSFYFITRKTVMKKYLASGITLFTLLFILVVSNVVAAEGAPVISSIQKSGKLVLGTSGTMPPMTEKLKSGKVVGLDIDLANMMAETMGVKLVIKVLPFEQLIPALESGKVDVVISNMTINPSRNMHVAFVGPYMNSGKCMITKEAVIAKTGDAEKLNQKQTSIAVLKGSTSEEFARTLLSKAKVVPVKDYAAGIKLVKEGKVKAMLSDYPICVAVTRQHADEGFVTIFSTLTYEPIGIALPANDPLFINWTENFLARLENVGLLKMLGTKWLGDMNLQEMQKQ
jgi:polar amino acid transport system substrate-binding protein